MDDGDDMEGVDVLVGGPRLGDGGRVAGTPGPADDDLQFAATLSRQKER